MMTITFKSGRTLKLSEEEWKVLHQNMMNLGTKVQMFGRPETGLPYKFVNCDEIESVVESSRVAASESE